jgi:acyl-CoA synthetase (AMP-forming)/AMP-acid ligase II
LHLLPIALTDWGNWSETDVSMVAMPLFHIAGCEWAYVAFCLGATNIVMPDVDPGQILSDIETYGVTQTLFVPAVILFLLQHPNCAKTDFSSIKSIVYGASPISLPLLQQAVETMGCSFAQVYGLTETTGAFTYLAPEDHDGTDKMKSCGKVMHETEVRVIDPQGNVCPTGKVGEIVCRSKQVMKGYWKRPEATAQAIVDGWFKTGDAGYFDADGYLYVHDRLKDMISSGGENIYPAETESALASHEALADIAIIDIPDDQWGEQVKAVIVVKPEAKFDESEFEQFCRARLAGYKIPRSIDIVNELPRNPSGKILNRVLRAPY